MIAGIDEITDKADLIMDSSNGIVMSVEAQGKVVFFADNASGVDRYTFSMVKLFRDLSSIEGEDISIIVENVAKIHVWQ